jgi:ketosteroid isomerase-like protein
MSQENVETLKRGAAAYERRDLDALLEVLDPEVEWHSALLAMFRGRATVYRGHEGLRRLFEEMDEVLTDFHIEIFEIRDLGERLVTSGRIRVRGKESRAETESPVSSLIEFKNGKVLRIWIFLDATAALEAAGLRE